MSFAFAFELIQIQVVAAISGHPGAFAAALAVLVLAGVGLVNEVGEARNEGE